MKSVQEMQAEIIEAMLPKGEEYGIRNLTYRGYEDGMMTFTGWDDEAGMRCHLRLSVFSFNIEQVWSDSPDMPMIVGSLL